MTNLKCLFTVLALGFGISALGCGGDDSEEAGGDSGGSAGTAGSGGTSGTGGDAGAGGEGDAE
jgi:hypothetical protein